jgi:hypothetical protein
MANGPSVDINASKMVSQAVLVLLAGRAMLMIESANDKTI